MFSKTYRICFAAAMLLIMAACAGGDVAGDSADTVSVAIHAEFEKKTITSAGAASETFKPARYCWAEGFDPQTNQIYFSGYLNSMGLGIADVPKGINFKVRLIARFEAPGKNNYGDFQMRGSVKNGVLLPFYNDTEAFNDIPDWSVLSDEYLANRDLSIKIRALDSTPDREAGAFNIAYQAIEFASKMALLEPSLGLPNLHPFWSSDNQHTDYPRAAHNKQNRVLAQSTGRTIFQHRIAGAGSAQTSVCADEYNDSALMESFAHLLFADYSFPPVNPGRHYDSIIRRDCEEAAWIPRQTASDSTVAFVSGFCDFISAAFRNSPFLTDVAPENINTYNLSAPTAFPKARGGEFYRLSVAAALYKIWTNALGGSQKGLQTMWDATFKLGIANNLSDAAYPHGYLQCPVGNISSYLSGFANGAHFGVTPEMWGSILAVLDGEAMGNPNADYFNQGVFWKKINSFPAVETGTIKTYPNADGLFWNINQAVCYKFTQERAGSRKITLELTGGQDLFLELFDAQGIVDESAHYNHKLTNREFKHSELKPGNYVVRVRAGHTTQDKPAGFRLTIE